MTSIEEDHEAAPSESDAQGSRPKRSGWKVATVALVTVVGIIVATGLGLAVWLNSSLSDITRVQIGLDESIRPAHAGDDSVNILLMGTDAGQDRNPGSSSVMEDAAADVWPQGKHRSDASLLIHVPSDREHLYVISIMRDSFVRLHDDKGEPAENAKINAALSLYGPSGAVATFENFTGLRIDHFALLDWDGFEGITDALGGVEMDLADGRQTLSGAEALDYVRARKTLPHGDFDRVQRQQNFLRAVLSGAFDAGTLRNPVKLKRTLDATTSHLAVDESFSNGAIRSLAWSLRSLRPHKVTYMTAPTLGTDRHPTAGSIVVVDQEKSDALFTALRDGSIEAAMGRYDDLELPQPGDVP